VKALPAMGKIAILFIRNIFLNELKYLITKENNEKY